ncbi:peptidase inhibitor 16 [Equus przewalskii]|uniref:Peptidase inhibitor 16 n=1 Tax=Equus przewalskii TaxID=9798 RepID=A0ABM2F715_EQUPR|nr:peptidase inhibitor 16 isoform X1 [Equus caballus]XP_005603915.1 peptidase inhibitor 16 isoform X1 [Equus caballus]XP_008526988.1 PREDICTED: peptidase inhibitor 16 [Equus przewalskii]XP_008526989.1 PREDICTED: peptidase inhibitor 16 [Equus przewalskii]XP_008526991.1 PREDICTED: peptidase inhibitor 16 [Equus przewalskii]
MLGVDSALPETLCELGQASRHSLSHPPQPGWCLCGKDFKSSCQTPEWERQRVLATMHSSHSLLALLLPLLLLLVAITGPAGALSDDEKHVMVKLHNLYRAQVSPPAADMLQMRWDEELAAFAKAYAQQCIWGHNKERGRRGENLFAITDEAMDVPLAVEQWYQEHDHYNLSAGTCDPGQMCGHYTQVVWAKTERIGCGSHFCEKLQGVEETNIQLLVCNYEPPGNVKRQRPYQEGTPCSQCPSGYHCEISLCEPIRGPEEAEDLPYLVTEAPSSLATEVPSVLATHSQLSLDEGPATFPKSTHDPTPKSADREASRTRMPSRSPESSLHPKVSLTGTQEPLPYSPEEGEAEAELPPSTEVSASVIPVQDEPGELQATLDHMGHTSSKSLPNSPNTSATANATGGRTLVLQSSLPGAEGPGKPGIKSGLNSGGGRVWVPLLGLLLLPPLVLAGIF